MMFSVQVADEAVESEEGAEVKEPELPNFTKVCSLALPEAGLPPRMFTAGWLIKLLFRKIFIVL